MKNIPVYKKATSQIPSGTIELFFLILLTSSEAEPTLIKC